MDISKMTLGGSYVLVKEIRREKATQSGIVIQGRDKEQTNQGIVLLVGPGSKLENGKEVPVYVKVGQKVLYSSFAGSPIKEKESDPDTYLILNERDILCAIDE